MKAIGIISGVLLIIFGGYCLMHPVATFASLGWLVGAVVLISGVGGFCAWWDGRKTTSTGWDLASAIISVVFGILVLVNVKAMVLTDMALIVLFGVWIAIGGIIRIIVAIMIKPPIWGLSLVWGIVLILVAIFALIHPLTAVISLGWCIAFAFITQGINLIIIICTFMGKKDN